MATFYNPGITTSNLVFALDPANTKSYNYLENRIPRSQELNTGWTNNGVALTNDNTIAPDGTLTAELVLDTTTSNRHTIWRTGTIPYYSMPVTASVYAKDGPGTRYLTLYAANGGYQQANRFGTGFDLVNGQVANSVGRTAGSSQAISASILNVGNGWYRCSITGIIGPADVTGPDSVALCIGLDNNFENAAIVDPGYAGDGASGLYIWGAQLNIGTVAQPYVVTEASAITPATSMSSLVSTETTSTFTGGMYFDYANSGGIYFDGVSDKLTFTTLNTSTGNQSYEVWCSVSLPATNDGYGYILHNNSANNTLGGSSFAIGIKPTNAYFGAFNGAWGTMDTGVLASQSNVVQIVITWDGTTQKLYLNGSLKDSQALSGTLQNFSTTTSIGDYAVSTMRPVQGKIYSVKAYSKALTDTEVANNFDALRGRYGI
jgi:hypothetical protein